ncbi:MAG: rod shape-determining protein MreC [Gemmatimonadaceae bacterium]|nr:rod shape-determining protein MreC [Gemmatimonadaceae bacterium]
MARTSRTGTRTDLALLGVALAIAVASLILPAAARGKVQGSLRSSVAAPLVSAQAWAERGRQAIVDHSRLVNRVDSLALGVQSGEPLRAENDRLRALLGLGQRLQWGFVATELMYPPRGGDEHTVLLAAGSAAGVRPFSPLVVPEGLIGMVTTVDASSSTAILWTHPDFRASATTTDGLAFGIVAAHLGSGADRFLLEMRGVPFRSELKPGTLIVTSGLGNVFPRGIPIGVVLRETKTIEGWARTFLIRPIVSPDASSAAMVLLPPRVTTGVTDAWSSASAAEGTQKGIAAAGDSILADSVRKVQAQIDQLALLDSLRRAAIYRGDSGIRVESDSVPNAATRPSGAPPVASPVTPAARPAAVAPAAATPAGPGARTAAPVRRDTSVRQQARARTPDNAKPRMRVDSAQGKNKRDTTKAPENPFRLPPAGARE